MRAHPELVGGGYSAEALLFQEVAGSWLKAARAFSGPCLAPASPRSIVGLYEFFGVHACIVVKQPLRCLQGYQTLCFRTYSRCVSRPQRFATSTRSHTNIFVRRDL